MSLYRLYPRTFKVMTLGQILSTRILKITTDDYHRRALWSEEK